jgi:Domain of Unknown Function (DUF1259)
MTPILALSLLSLIIHQNQTPADWRDVERALGRPGAVQNDVYRVGFPRSDLHVTVGRVAVKPALALGSWVAFKQTSDSTAMLMGDLVLLESEVAPVIDALRQGGIEQTAVHNHLLHESPHVLYVHVAGQGPRVALATTIRAALARTGTPPPAPAPQTPPPLGLDTARIAEALGAHGRVNGGVYQVSVPRDGAITVDNVEIPPAMGVATAINFQSVGGGTGKAATTGDFVMIASEVSAVIQALRANGIEVTALHSHMLTESPRLLFMHFWGEGDALALARGLRAALDHMSVKRG